MVGKLRKLRGKSLAELSTRTRQRISILAERAGLSTEGAMPTDKQLFGWLGSDMRGLNPDQLFEHFRSRSPANFYASTHDIRETIAELRRKFPEEEAAIIARADRISGGSFDLLGYRNLHFRGNVPDWHFDPVSKKTSPRIHWSTIDEVSSRETGDKKVIWELNRHQYFSALGRAYWFTGDEKYAHTWANHITDWMANNPPKIGVNWLSSLELSFRSMSWIWSIYFFRHSPVFTSELLLQILKFLYLNARHLERYLSTYFSPNTHLTGEALGLYFIGSFVPEFEDAKRWQEQGNTILMDALDFQVRSDGTYVEQSSHYHRYTTDFYANLIILRELEESTVERKHREKLDQLLEFLMHIQQPNGETPLFGDEDGGRLYFFDERAINDFRPTLALGAVLLERGDLKFAAGEPSPELLWLLGPEGMIKFESVASMKPEKLVRQFAVGGYFTARSSWLEDADQIIIQCGPHGFLNGGHAHADALNFTMSVGGRPVFVDSGTYVYTADREARDRYRSSQAHNCLTVNGESSSKMDGPFSWQTFTDGRLREWTTRDDETLFSGDHDGFRGLGVDYQRTIHIAGDGVVRVKETITSSQTNLFEMHFILSPELDAVIDTTSGSVAIVDSSLAEVLVIKSTIAGENADEGAWRKEAWSVSHCYGSETSSRKLVFQIKARGRLEVQHHFLKPGG